MKKILLFITLLMPLLGLAQERFYYLYDGWRINEIVVKNDQYYSFGSIGHPDTYGNLPQFNIIGGDGILEESFSHYSDTTDGLEAQRTKSYLLREDTVIFVGTYVDYSKSYSLNPVMMRYNMNTRDMDTIIRYNHCVESEAILYLIDTTTNGYLLTGSYLYTDYNSFPILLFINSAGDTLSTKRHPFITNQYLREVAPYQMLHLPDGGYLMSCQDINGLYQNQFIKVRSLFIRLDSEGNELWRNATASSDTACYHPFAFLLDNGEFLISWTDPALIYSAMNPNMSLWFAKMNAEGVYDKKKIQYYLPELPNHLWYINDYYTDTDGNMYLVGEGTYYIERGFLLKMNPEGEVLWYRDYECFPDNDAASSYTKLYSMTPTPDGGFILGGEYYSSAGSMFPSAIQKALAVKVDNCGCLEEGCNPDCYNGVSTQTIKALHAEVFPNPASVEISLSIPVIANTANIKVFDVSGCEWMNIQVCCTSDKNNNSQTAINIKDLPAGIYIINIWAKGKFCTGKFVKE